MPEMSAQSQNLVLLFFTTAGQNAENLGSDEEQIVSCVYLLYDIPNNKIVTLQNHYVRPVSEDGCCESVLTEECKAQTQLNEEKIKNAQPLEHVLDELDRFLSSKEIHPDHGGRPFCICTDGMLHLRMVLHPEASRKGITLPSYCYRYYDLRREFKQFYKAQQINAIQDMLEFLNLEEDLSVEYGVRHCQEMAKIMSRMINDGHTFSEPEIVKDKLEPGICSKYEYVDDETVIRARGLPWQSSDADIALFFKGLNVAKGGVALCLSQQGRRNGEALIRFDSKEHRDLALRKHKHHLGQRYIEVYKASGKDFINVAGGNSMEAKAFLSRHSEAGAQVIVRMRGLPYTCTAEQILEFFRAGDNSVEVLDGEEGILFVHQADGRATGDAFVLFSAEDEANKALTKHRESIGTRYIELFKSTTAEVQQVLNRSMDPRTPVEIVDAHLPLMPPMPSLPLLPQQFITSGNTRDCIRLRGLPQEASVTDILAFLGEYSKNIQFQGVHMVYSAQGIPSGEAFIQMDGEQAAELTALNRNRKYMFHHGKKRYLEVIQCSGTTPPPSPHSAAATAVCAPTASEEMSMILGAGSMPLNGTMAPATSVMNGGLAGAAGAMISGLPSPMAAMPMPALPAALPAPQTMMPPMMGLPGATQLQRPMLSPANGALMQHPGTAVAAATAGATNAAAAAMGGMGGGLGAGGSYAMYSAYQQYTQPPMIAAPAPTTLPSTTVTPNGLGALAAPRPNAAAYAPVAAAAPGAAYPPMFYWYPSPPVSPQSQQYYVSTSPSTIVVKGLPFTATQPEVLAIFDGIYEIAPDIQIQRGADGRATGEAYVTFASRAEAERAVTERNRKPVGNRYIELHMA